MKFCASKKTTMFYKIIQISFIVPEKINIWFISYFAGTWKKSTVNCELNNALKIRLCWRAFHRYGQAKCPNSGLILGSSQLSKLPQLSPKILLDLKLVKIDPKIIMSLSKYNPWHTLYDFMRTFMIIQVMIEIEWTIKILYFWTLFVSFLRS